MNKTKTYYQPEWHRNDGFDLEWGGTPDKLMSFHAFADKETCREWLLEHDYNVEDFAIIEYHDEDIEEVTIIDEYGDIIETNESE